MMKMIKEVILWTILLLKFFYELWLVPYAMIFTDIVKTFWKVFFNGTYVTEGTVPQGSAWAMNPIPRQGNIKKTITNFLQKCQQSDSGTTRLRQDKALPRDARNVLSADRPAFKVIVFAQVCKWWQWLSWWWPGWPSDDTLPERQQ